MKKTTIYAYRLVETPIFPKGRNYRISGRVLRTIIKEYDLLCAAARRKRPERRPETSGDNQKLGKRPYFRLPETDRGASRENRLPYRI